MPCNYGWSGSTTSTLLAMHSMRWLWKELAPHWEGPAHSGPSEVGSQCSGETLSLTYATTHADALHPWVVWLYYINPLNYAFRAVVVEEFSAPHWDGPAPSDPAVRAGTAVLRANGLDLPKLWMWASVLILLGYIFLINVVVIISLKLLNGKPPRQEVRLIGPIHVMRRCALPVQCC